MGVWDSQPITLIFACPLDVQCDGADSAGGCCLEVRDPQPRLVQPTPQCQPLRDKREEYRRKI